MFLVIMIVFINGLAFSKPMTLTFASIGPPKGYIGDAEQLFFDEIEKQTNGEVLIQRSSKYFHKTDEIFDEVSSGRVELGALNIAYYPKRLILNSSIYLFQRGPTHYDNIMWIYDQIYKRLPELNNEIKQFNLKTIYRFANLPTVVFFNKPVTSIEDFKGKRIRCTSRWDSEILQGLGAVPITSSGQNLYTALKTNAIEGFMTSMSANVIQFNEIMKYVFIAREIWTPRPLQITINLDTWNSLPEDIQNEIEIAASNVRKKMTENYSYWFRLNIAEHKKLGRTIVLTSEKDIDTWMQQPEIKRIFNQWKVEAESAGFKDSDIFLQRIQSIIEEGIERDMM
ncbi:TRAP transporter substrate-binding protein [Desulfopila aestuarii]|nr:TRAP transporter substrate-binding protein DctP [Desulfopila aestuarii]